MLLIPATTIQGGEEAFVLEGEVFFNHQKLVKGDYLYTPPTFKHSAKTDTGCVILFVVPQEVAIYLTNEKAAANMVKLPCAKLRI